MKQQPSDGLAAHSAQEDLQRALRQALRNLAAEKKSKADLASAVFEAAKSAALAYPTPKPIKRPPKQHGPGDPEWALLHLTDWQLGKKTVTYGSGAAQKSVQRVIEKTLALTDLNRKARPITSCAVLLGGDMVEGTQIFPAQSWQVDSALYDQLFNVSSLIEQSVRTLLAEFDHVEVWDEYGNHGRLGRKGEQPALDNVDRMAYRIAREKISDKRLTWHPSTSWYQVGNIGNYSFLLVHGDEVNSFGGNVPAFGITRKCNAWSTGVIEPFKDVYMGHWHRPDVYTLANGGRCFVSGSTESGSEFAREFIAALGTPCQRLNFIDPERGRVTSEHQIWLA